MQACHLKYLTLEEVFRYQGKKQNDCDNNEYTRFDKMKVEEETNEGEKKKKNGI